MEISFNVYTISVITELVAICVFSYICINKLNHIILLTNSTLSSALTRIVDLERLITKLIKDSKNFKFVPFAPDKDEEVLIKDIKKDPEKI